MTHPDYQKTLDYLYSRLPMYQRDGAPAIKLGLEKTNELCWALGMPQWKLNSIHVAGTNGKGSVASMLASILTEAGYRTGLYTSPHLADFSERIRINGQPISQQAVVEFMDCYRLAIEKIEPTFFELCVGMAFEFFAEQETDINVIEVGLGGRLDSTNVIKPEVSVITNIGYDHMDVLGDTLEQIAGEKAGIIKKYTPAVVGKRHEATDPVFQRHAFEKEADLFFAEDRFSVTRTPGADAFQTFKVGKKTYETDLHGHYQQENLTTVLMTVEVLRQDGWEIPEVAVREGLKKVRKNSGLRGRMERLQSQPTVICDVAHNLDGLTATLPQVLAMPHRQLHIVWGMVREKDTAAILNELPTEANYYYVRPDVPRGLDAEILASQATHLGLAGNSYESVEAGLKAALSQASPEDLIYVGGSTFVVAEVLEKWKAMAPTV